MTEVRDKLAGNGVGLVREIALASRVQKALETLYRVERSADVDAFLVRADEGERETLLFREAEDGSFEMLLRIPSLGGDGEDLDPICQIIEGVSHFVYLAHRAQLGREATQLELELQAEVDKYVVLAASLSTRDARFDEITSKRLRGRLYDAVSFTHDADTTEGERYRVANATARRFTARLERDYLARARFGELQSELRAFFHMGQGAKLRAA